MAPTKSRKNYPTTSTVETSNAEESRESSPDNTTNYLKQAQDLVKRNQARRQAKRNAIEDGHKKHVKDLKIRLESLYDSKKAKVVKLQHAQWERLNVLNKRRQALESLILQSMNNIEVYTRNIALELDAVYKGRLDDLQQRAPTPTQ